MALNTVSHFRTPKHAQIYVQVLKTNDKSAEISFNDLPAGSLHLADLGYFSLADLEQKDADGTFWLTKIPANTGFFDANDNRIELADWLKSQPADRFESEVWLGCHVKLD